MLQEQNGIMEKVLPVERLVHTVQELSLARDIESVMRIVRTVARQLTGADGATFVLRDGDKCYYADEDAISPLWKGSRFPLQSCISGWAMLNKKQAVVEDIYADPRIPADAYRPTFVKSLVMVPIRTLNPIGAIGNYWATRRMPTEQEVKLLQSLADITAVSIENIEVRNQLEEKVQERTQELIDSLEREKANNEMKSAFVSIASHEFRTPLSTILSSTGLVEKYNENQQYEKQLKHIARIKSSVENMNGILSDFLSLDKLEQGKVELQKTEIDLEEFILKMTGEVEGIRKPYQTIHYKHEGEKNILVDANILRNVLLNLFSNALKYSEKDVEVASFVSPGFVRINVRDYGIGIPEEQHKKMFGKFFRANNTGSIKGTGLGLNIVKRYVELLGGTIDFISKENEGTMFTVTLPHKAVAPREG